MAKCYHCGSETSLHIANVPVCTDCDKLQRIPLAKKPDQKTQKNRPESPDSKLPENEEFVLWKTVN
jgi:hypothetical protein